jgi:hypothetical protein
MNASAAAGGAEALPGDGLAEEAAALDMANNWLKVFLWLALQFSAG